MSTLRETKHALTIRGKDRAGHSFEEQTLTEKISPQGASVLLEHEAAEGSTVEVGPPLRISLEAEKVFQRTVQARVIRAERTPSGKYRVSVVFSKEEPIPVVVTGKKPWWSISWITLVVGGILLAVLALEVVHFYVKPLGSAPPPVSFVVGCNDQLRASLVVPQATTDAELEKLVLYFRDTLVTKEAPVYSKDRFRRWQEYQVAMRKADWPADLQGATILNIYREQESQYASCESYWTSRVETSLEEQRSDHLAAAFYRTEWGKMTGFIGGARSPHRKVLFDTFQR
ncbi:MAG: hypothetical protein HY652_11020 [Acidobacteria bacterium]|nr:hypothetical protein [Acidobacteriota bacterium]